ncbi:MAG: hypothetical protein ACYTE8_11820 [Planctomycetota bacterium]|jgi:hypothetical protein
MKLGEAMRNKLGPRDIRAIKLGALGVVAVVAFVFGSKWFDHWSKVRTELNARKKLLAKVNLSQAKREGLWKIVPNFEMPAEQEEQKYLFREKLFEQLQKAGVKSGPLQFSKSTRASRKAGRKSLRLECRKAKCKFGQTLDLLATLKENPYLAGIEEFKISCDPKKRQEFELDLVVTTYVK